MLTPRFEKIIDETELENSRLRSGMIAIQKIAGVIEGVNRSFDNEFGNKLTRKYFEKPETSNRSNTAHKRISRSYAEIKLS